MLNDTTYKGVCIRAVGHRDVGYTPFCIGRHRTLFVVDERGLSVLFVTTEEAIEAGVKRINEFIEAEKK